MKTPLLRRFLALAAGFLTMVSTQAQESIHAIRGLYSLNGNLNSRWNHQPPLSASNFTTTYGSETMPDAATSQFLQLPAFNTTQALVLNNWAATNGSAGINGGSAATRTNRWTLAVDIKPTLAATWNALLQTNIANNDDAEIFINSSGQIHIKGFIGSPGTVTANQWQRLVFVCSNDNNNGACSITAYRNGILVGTSVTRALDAEFSLGAFAYLFADDNSETSANGVNAIGFWTYPLTAGEVSSLGGPKGSSPEIQWTSMPTATALPGLTGKLKFGNFELSLPPSGFQLGSGNVQFTTQSAFVAAYPNYTLGGTRSIRLAANGDLLYTGTATFLNVTGSPLVRLNNVLVNPGGINLFETGATSSAYTVYLPVGMGVTTRENSRRLVQTASIGAQPLLSNLAPTTNIQSLNSAAFNFNPGENLWVSLENFPIRYRVSSVSWSANTGAFLIPNTGTVSFDRAYERTVLAEWNSISGIQGTDPRPSNDDVFASVISTSDTIVDVNANGIPRVRESTITFANGNTSGFQTHFPRGAQIRWSSGGLSRLRYTTSQLDTNLSYLYEGLSCSLSVRRDSTSSGCGTLAGNRTFTFTPPDHWTFTRDGGLHGLVTFNQNFEWGAIDASSFAHRITSSFGTAAFMMPGNCLRAEDYGSTPIHHRVAALLLSGNGNGSTPETTIERPSTASYYNGQADYAGINLRIANNGTHNATSTLAGTPLSYSLRNTSKFNLRPAGITGVLDAVTQTPGPGQSYPISTVLAGYAVGLSDVRLSFLDSKNVGSGINGAFNLPSPALLTNLTVERLRFGDRGELLNATFPTSTEMTLGYWGCKLTPHAIHFALPDVACPNPASSVLVLGSEVKLPALSDQAFHGQIGFKPNGHTVVPADSLVLANGEKITSRLRPPSQLQLKGPGSTSYGFTPTAHGAYLNEFSSGNPDGFVALPGEIHVPFFQNLRVILHAKSSANATINSSLNVYAGDQTSPNFSFFGSTDPDPSNLGRPSASTLPGKPVARRNLWDLANLQLPLNWNSSTRRFTGDPLTNDLLLFNLKQNCNTLGPEVAELSFGASAEPGAKYLNTAKLLDAAGADSLNLLSSIQQKLGQIGSFTGSLTSVLHQLESAEILNDDQLVKLLAPGLENLPGLDAPADALYNALKSRYDSVGLNAFRNDPAATDAAFQAAVDAMVGPFQSLPAGEWKNAINASLDDASDVCTNLKDLVSDANNIIAIASAVLNQTPSATAGLSQTLQEISQTLDEIQLTINTIQGRFNGGIYQTLLQNSLGSDAQIKTWARQAVEQLQDDWVSQLNDPLGSGFFTPSSRRTEFKTAFRKAIAKGFVGSSSAHSLRTALSSATEDVLFQLRSSFDNILGTVNTTIQSVQTLPNSAVTTLGPVANAFQGASLTGFARIQGDSLQELRLDGEMNLKVPDDFKIRAWFILRDVDGAVPGDGTLAAGDVKTEVIVGASAPLSFLGQSAQANAELRVGIGASGPVCVHGSIGTQGNLNFQSIMIREAQFGVGIGQNDAYLYAKAAGELDAAAFAMSAEIALFFGKTSTLLPIQKVNPNVNDFLNQLGVATPAVNSPLYGAYMFAYGDFSVLSLLGIPPSCLLDLRIGGGQGYYGFYRPNAATLAGMQFAYGVRGQVLCLLDISGRLDGYLAGSVSNEDVSFNSMRAAGRMIMTLSGEIGIDPFSYDWSKNFAVDVFFDPQADPKVAWDIHY